MKYEKGVVPWNEVFDVHDPSKVQDFLTCPRYYWYKHVIGWRQEGSNLHLVYGSALHLAMEVLLTEGYGEEAILKAYSAFLKEYRKSFSEESDLEMQKIGKYRAKTPIFVLDALTAYCAKYEVEDKDQKVLHVEVAGSVPVSNRHRLHFRLDSIIEDHNGMIRSREHKTGSQLSAAWTDQWHTKHQISTYTHALMCHYGPDRVWGVEVNGIIATVGTKSYVEENGTGYQFVRVPIKKKREVMNAWLWEVNYWLDMIQHNFNQLEKATKDDKVLMAFPKNTESCTKYNRPCEYLPYCTAWANPLQYTDRVQIGMVQEWWDPRDQREKAGKIVDIKEMLKDES